MKKLKGKDLEFISQINRDGSGTTPVSKSYLEILQDEKFEMSVLSLTEKTYIAQCFNAFVVRLKNENPE